MRRNGSDYLKFYSIIFFSIIIIGYFIFNFRIFIAGPEIIITSPQNGGTTDQSLVEITGKAENVDFISLNDRSIFLDNNGNFREFLLLSSGYNIIIIKAQDKFKRSISKKLEIINNGNSNNHEILLDLENNFSTSTDSGTSTLNKGTTTDFVETNSE
jgi:hypothetical protein